MKRLPMRLTLLLVSVILLAGAFAGCQNESDDDKNDDTNDGGDDQPTTKTPLNWIGHWKGEHDRETLVNEVAQEFQVLHPEIELNMHYHQDIPNGGDKPQIAQLIANMIRTGNIEWDVVWLDDYIYQYVADELDDPDWGPKHLVDFGQLDWFPETQKSFIMDDPVYADKTGGIIVGPHLEGYYICNWYNQDVADMIGLDIKQYGMTFDDFLGYIEAVEAYNANHTTSIGAIYESSDWLTVRNWLFQNLFKSEMSSFDTAKAETGSDAKNQALLKTLEAMEELGQHEPLIDSQPNNVWFDTRDKPLNDECLFYINGIWMYNHWMGIDETKTMKMMPAELPGFNNVSYCIGGYIPTWAVMKDSPHKDEAIELMKFWSRPQVAEKWVRYTKAPTGIKGHLTSVGSGDDQFEQFQAKLTEMYGGNVHDTASSGYILGAQNRLLADEIGTQVMSLLRNETTAQNAYDAIMAQVQ